MRIHVANMQDLSPKHTSELEMSGKLGENTRTSFCTKVLYGTSAKLPCNFNHNISCVLVTGPK